MPEEEEAVLIQEQKGLVLQNTSACACVVHEFTCTAQGLLPRHQYGQKKKIFNISEKRFFSFQKKRFWLQKEMLLIQRKIVLSCQKSRIVFFQRRVSWLSSRRRYSYSRGRRNSFYSMLCSNAAHYHNVERTQVCTLYGETEFSPSFWNLHIYIYIYLWLVQGWGWVGWGTCC
jgi:hypothetical protein